MTRSCLLFALCALGTALADPAGSTAPISSYQVLNTARNELAQGRRLELRSAADVNAHYPWLSPRRYDLSRQRLLLLEGDATQDGLTLDGIQRLALPDGGVRHVVRFHREPWSGLGDPEPNLVLVLLEAGDEDSVAFADLTPPAASGRLVREGGALVLQAEPQPLRLRAEGPLSAALHALRGRPLRVHGAADRDALAVTRVEFEVEVDVDLLGGASVDGRRLELQGRLAPLFPRCLGQRRVRVRGFATRAGVFARYVQASAPDAHEAWVERVDYARAYLAPTPTQGGRWVRLSSLRFDLP